MNLLQLLKKLQKMKKLLKQAIMTERSIKTETVDANDGQLTFGWQTLRLLHRQICFSGFALSPRLSMKADRIDRIVFAFALLTRARRKLSAGSRYGSALGFPVNLLLFRYIE